MKVDSLMLYLKKRRRAIIQQDGYKPASVLIPITEHDRIYMILTKRSSNLNNHAGEVSFPGGRVDISDRNRLHTALRELHEEIGIPENEVNVIGILNDVVSITNFHIVPYVGVIPFFCPYNFNKSEIEKILMVPLKFFLEKPKVEIYKKGDIIRPNYIYNYKETTIFGVTAHIIKDFIEILEKSGFLKENIDLIT